MKSHLFRRGVRLTRSPVRPFRSWVCVILLSASGACREAPSPSQDLATTMDLMPSADLAPVRQPLLTLVRAGGGGVITSAIGSLRCDSTCDVRVPAGLRLVLRAEADVAAIFAGWSGGCQGSDPTCELTIFQDTRVEAVFGVPGTCDQIRATHPEVSDGEFTLFANKEPARPWQATCLFDTAPARTYLSVPDSPTQNFSHAQGGGGLVGTSLRTHYKKVRIDPERLLVDVQDGAFSTSVGSVAYGSDSPPLLSLRYGDARDCYAPDSQRGSANIDLTGTPFAVAPDSFRIQGYRAAGSTTYSADSKVVNLRGGGYCGVNRVNPGSMDPYSLQLLYQR